MVIELDSQYKKRKNQVEKIVEEIINQHQIDVSQTTLDNLIIHLSLCISRELNGTYIFTSESQINNLKEHELYPVAREIIHSLEKEFDVEIDENQMSYTTMYLANINLLDIDFNCEFDLCDDVMEDVINETVEEIKNQLHLDLKKNDEFYTGITLHFYPALERLQNDKQLTNNPLKSQIQLENEKEYECALIFNRVVETHYHKSFNEHELAYIALHFGTALI